MTLPATFLQALDAIEYLGTGSSQWDEAHDAARDLLRDCEVSRWREWFPLEWCVLVLLLHADLIDYGTNLNRSWRTELGDVVLAELTIPTICTCGHTARDHAVGIDAAGEPVSLTFCGDPCPCRDFTKAAEASA